jgi:glycosyltransferase involved in cell wall biosynthesis
MKILHYIAYYAPAWSFGGPARSVSTLCEALAKMGHEVTVFTTNAGLEDRSDIKLGEPAMREGVRVYYFSCSRNRMGICSAALENAVAERAAEFDLIHVTGTWHPTTRAAYKAARRAKVPCINSPRGCLSRYSFTQKPWKKFPYYWLVENKCLNASAAIHYTSDQEARECARLRLCPPSFVVPNPVSLQTWQRDELGGQEWRNRRQIEGATCLMLYAGRLHHKKGLDVLPRVCAALPKTSAWKLALAGFDEDGTGVSLRKAFGELGISDRLLLIPSVESSALRTIYSAADIFLFPSRHENFGNVIIEALGCGCPVLMSDQVGVADQVIDVAGVKVLKNHERIWSDYLIDFIVNRPVFDRAQLRAAVMARFSPESVASRMSSTYQKIILRRAM